MVDPSHTTTQILDPHPPNPYETMQDSYAEEDEIEMNVALVEDPESDDCRTTSDNNAYDDEPSRAPPSTSSATGSPSMAWRILGRGILSAAPMLALIGFGSGQQNMVFLFIYTFLVLLTSIPSFYLRHKSGVLRWFVGFVFVAILSGFKSGLLLQRCENFIIKATLYATTALWECSNAVVIIGGNALLERFGIQDLKAAFLYSCAPCQVHFVVVDGTTDTTSNSAQPNTRRHFLHISLCCLGLVLMYFTLDYADSLRNVISSVVVLELECMALITSMLVVILDLPSHLWQFIYDSIATPALDPSYSLSFASPRVVLPYGWVYSSTSTRQFWSRWSRPATQLIRHLLYYPLGGRDRWYLSIPIMFALNATSHYDLSFSLVGDRAEIWWNLIFGTLASVAMLEVVGDSYFAIRTDDGSTTLPKWYTWTRVVLVHLSLRLVLFLMIHKCFKTSLKELVWGKDLNL